MCYCSLGDFNRVVLLLLLLFLNRIYCDDAVSSTACGFSRAKLASKLMYNHKVYYESRFHCPWKSYTAKALNVVTQALPYLVQRQTLSNLLACCQWCSASRLPVSCQGNRWAVVSRRWVTAIVGKLLPPPPLLLLSRVHRPPLHVHSSQQVFLN